MADFLMTWGTAIGVFILTGGFMEAMNRTVGAKPGDHGLRGVWYVWRRWALVLMGAGLGAGTSALGMHTPIGDGLGYNILNGVVAAFVAANAYELIVGSAKAKLKHRLARESRVPDEPGR
jgi:hypothetical protein